MKKFLISIIAITALVALMAACVTAKKPPKPPPAPCGSNSIEAYNEDFCGQSMWIAVTNANTAEQILCPFCADNPRRDCNRILSWIGGTVVADPAYEHGFYFEPSTVIVAEVTAEGMQTSICQIAANPGLYDGGLWYISFHVTEVREY